jgi:Rieske Fe-S protein
MQNPRRTFLKLLASAPLMACTGNSPSPASFGDVSAGNVKNLPVGALQVVSGQPVIIGRDSGGLYAVTITCTHQGCDVAPNGSGTSATLRCPCHGSQFDRNGAVIRGPAGSPLAHFAVEVDGAGNVTIHGGTEVEASVRVAAAT